jgi:hypothetical protein
LEPIESASDQILASDEIVVVSVPPPGSGQVGGGFYDVTENPESPFQPVSSPDYREPSAAAPGSITGFPPSYRESMAPIIDEEAIPPVSHNLSTLTPPYPLDKPPELSANSPMADLIAAFVAEFKDNLWLMGRLRYGMSDTSNGSFEIDKDLNVIPKFDPKSAQIEIIRIVMEEKKLSVYYSARFSGVSGVRNRNLSAPYFLFELTSSNIFTMIRQKREGALGFEIVTEEIAPSRIPPPPSPGRFAL